MRHQLFAVIAMGVALLVSQSAHSAEPVADGRVIYIYISKDDKQIASTMAGVRYHGDKDPKDLWKYLTDDKQFSTLSAALTKEGGLPKPVNGKTTTLTGNISLKMGFSHDRPFHTVSVDRLTLTFVSEEKVANKWTVTKWTISPDELKRLRKL